MRYFLKIACFTCILSILYSSQLEDNPELSYYIEEFQVISKSSLRDTLFEKIVWHRKVSHLLLEEKEKHYYVTLLMILSYPYNYKSTNYPIHYVFTELLDAQKKMKWVDQLLRENVVFKVFLDGNTIIKEKILYKSSDSVKNNRK